MTTLGLLRMTEFTDEIADHAPYAGFFERMFAPVGIEVRDIPVFEGAAPASVDECDGWIVSGSPRSVYEDLDWIRTAEEIVRAAVAAERPLIGICFGHQLVAQALGGRVERAAGWGVGPKDYTAGAERLTILAMHQDQVVEAPSDAVVWSTADYCPISGMTIGERVWTHQGHPEFTPELVRAIATRRRDQLGHDVVDAALDRLDEPLSTSVVATTLAALVTGP